MVKLAGPCFSIDASGKLGGALVFSKWKSVKYARSLVTPANPQSGPQRGVRAMFKFLSQEWDGLSAASKATWLDRAAQLNASTFNAYVSYDQSRWRNFLTPSHEDPAVETSTAPDLPTLVGTAGVRQVSLAITHGTNLADWGYLIFRSLTSTYDPAFSNCIAVVPVDGSGDAVYVDTPLLPDTYYYMATGFNDDGKVGTVSAEEDVVVT